MTFRCRFKCETLDTALFKIQLVSHVSVKIFYFTANIMIILMEK